MSKSVRHTPILGATKATSESADKAIWHRRFRRQSKLSVFHMEDPDSYIPPAVRQVSNPWSMAKDGHFYVPAAHLTEKALRK
jgi:hypothetical protein